MDTRTDLQRLLEDMDKMIRRKQQELTDLDERLEIARVNLSEKEAQELLKEQQQLDSSESEGNNQQQQQLQMADGQQKQSDQQRQAEIEEYLREQRRHFEQQIGRLTDECLELEAANRRLVELNDRLRFECDSSRVSGEKLRAKQQALSESLEEVQSANFELNIRLAKAESESQMQRKLLEKSHEQDQVLMDAFNNKLESLREALALRDEEIRRLRSDNQLTLESLGIRLDDAESDGGQLTLASPSDGDSEQAQPPGSLQVQSSDGLIDSSNKRRIIHIANLIRDKNAQIELLKQQLIQMTSDLERNTSLLQRLSSGSGADKSAGLRPIGDKTTSFASANASLMREAPSGEDGGSLSAKCQMLEMELEEKDKQLNRIEWRNRHLELVLPNGVAELLNGLKSALLLHPEQMGREIGGSNLASVADESDKFKVLMVELNGQLGELLGRLESARAMLDSVEQLQLVIKNKDGQIRRLVRELNQLSAEINHDRIEFVPDQGEDNDETVETSPPNGQQRQQQQLAAAADDDERAQELNSHERAKSIVDLDKERDAAAAAAAAAESNEKAAAALLEDSMESDQKAISKLVDHQLDSSATTSDNSIRMHLEQQQQQKSTMAASYSTEKTSVHLAPSNMHEDDIARATTSDHRNDMPADSGAAIQLLDKDKGGRVKRPLVPDRVLARRQSIRHQSAAAAIKKRSFAAISRLTTTNHSIKLRQKQHDGLSGSQPKIDDDDDDDDDGPNKGESNGRATGGGRAALERALDLHDRLRQLENENQLLELAMKEILLALKWSDSRCSTLLIDCPSLERLCQLIEARFIAASEPSGYRAGGNFVADLKHQQHTRGSARLVEPSRGRATNDTGGSAAQTCDNLFQFVVMKSELDLLRGQNEQLRADLKLQRREFHDHLAAEIESKSFAGAKRANDESIDGVNVDQNEEEPRVERCEAEIQTIESSMQDVLVFDQTTTQKRTGDKCQKCPRLIKLANHLLESIVRIETRVNTSDETYISRLLTLYQLTQRLSRDLSEREHLIARYQRDCHLIAQQKLFAESQRRSAESQLELHTRICPLTLHVGHQLCLPVREKPPPPASSQEDQRSLESSMMLTYRTNHEARTNGQVQLFASTTRRKDAHDAKSIQTFSMQQQQQQESGLHKQDMSDEMQRQKLVMPPLTRDGPAVKSGNKITTALLQSIIACLQARIDYKDQRLIQLEQMLTCGHG